VDKEFISYFIFRFEFSGKCAGRRGDWQIMRPDGCLENDTRYTLQTQNGSLIYLQNKGIRLSTYMRTVTTMEVQDPANA
jgi:hypothetical protein